MWFFLYKISQSINHIETLLVQQKSSILNSEELNNLIEEKIGEALLQFKP
jgi:hypothetical protein